MRQRGGASSGGTPSITRRKLRRVVSPEQESPWEISSEEAYSTQQETDNRSDLSDWNPSPPSGDSYYRQKQQQSLLHTTHTIKARRNTHLLTLEALDRWSQEPTESKNYTATAYAPKQYLFEMTRLDDFHVRFRNPHHVPDKHYKYFLREQQERSRSRKDMHLSHQKGQIGAPSATWQDESNVQFTTYNSAYPSPDYLHNPPNMSESYPKSFVNRTCFASTCGGFSIIAAIFLLWVGILLDTQPLYIGGVLPMQAVVQEVQITTSSNKNRNSHYSQLYVNYKNKNQQQQQNNNMQDGDIDNGDGTVTKTRQKITKTYQIPLAHDRRLNRAVTAYRASIAYLLTAALCWYFQHPQRSIHSVWYRWRKKYSDIDDGTAASHSSSALPTYHGAADDFHVSNMNGGSAIYQQSIWKQTVENVRLRLAQNGILGRRRTKNAPKMI